MPDGVTIPGGPGFAGSPQPPDVPCDPAGEAWRGPPGPAGPPGPQRQGLQGRLERPDPRVLPGQQARLVRQERPAPRRPRATLPDYRLSG